MTHLLPLSTLHSSAPGVLDVLFGRDGDFEGAPRHTSLVLWHPTHGWANRILATGSEVGPHCLDLRIPSVAARVAGLCALAIDPRAVAAVFCATGTADHGFLGLRYTGGFLAEGRRTWNRSTGTELSDPPTGVVLPPRCDAASGLAALFLTLAPRIAALGGT